MDEAHWDRHTYIHDVLLGQGTIGCTPNSVPMEFVVFSRDSWRSKNIYKDPRAIGLI